MTMLVMGSLDGKVIGIPMVYSGAVVEKCTRIGEKSSEKGKVSRKVHRKTGDKKKGPQWSTGFRYSSLSRRT